MSLIINKQPVEIAFIFWLNNYPESFHPLDMERFYSFVKTKIRYRNKKFDDYDYFSTRIKKHSPNFTDDHIQYFWDEIIRVERILRAPILPRIELTNDDNIENTQINVIDDRFIYTEITNEEYRNSGISIAEVKRRIKK